tara:strand:- start:35 stop:523 length:489 start_codon:yes stop_codon:yes gene_type:complete
MAATWKINNLTYYLNKVDGRDKVVYKTDYKVTDSKTVGDDIYKGIYVGSIIHDLEIVEAVDKIPEVPEVLYTDKDTLLVDKAVKVGDVKTPAVPAVPAVKAKNPWASVDFVEYDNLTEDIVVGWIKNILGDDKVKEIEDNLASQIDAQVNPPAATEGNGVPW